MTNDIASFSGMIQPEQGIKASRREISFVIRSAFRKAGLEAEFTVWDNRMVSFAYAGKSGGFENLRLDEKDRTEESRTGFDAVLAYVINELAGREAYYNGTIICTSATGGNWELNVRHGQVFRSEGEWKLVFDRENEFEVGGYEL